MNGQIVQQSSATAIQPKHRQWRQHPHQRGGINRKPQYVERKCLSNPSGMSPFSGICMYPTTGFRLDINGLRAWAVIAVLLYHFEIPGFAGGFAGVDVFFVISGFLMTGIVQRELEEGSFKFLDFWSARARRIIPALLALCVTLLLLGWLALPPSDYKSLASHAVYSLLFISNIEYWLSAGYFDSTSHEKWLLHTWSLSVEWQFYLILPIILWTAWKIKRGTSTQQWTLTVILLTSLLAALLLTPRDGTASFYLLHTRAWELLAGGILSSTSHSHVPEKFRKTLSLTGLTLIASSVLLFTPETPWPHWGTLAPVTGTMLVIAGGYPTALTHHRWVQWVGERSYSLYLWHWPVYVVLVTLEWRQSPWAIPSGLFVAVVIAMLSYRFVERPSRRVLTAQNVKITLTAVSAATICVSAMGFMVWRAQGFPSRLPIEAQAIMAEQQKTPHRAKECEGTSGVASPMCEFGHSITKILVIGDSHVLPMMPAATRALPNLTWIPISYVGCPLIKGLKSNKYANLKRDVDYNCEAHNRWVQDMLSNQPPQYPALLVGRYAIQAVGLNESGRHQNVPVGYISEPTQQATAESIREMATALTQTACELARHRQVFMLRPIPEMPVHVPQTAIRRIMFGTPTGIHTPIADYKRRNEWVWQAQEAAKEKCNVVLLDATDTFCPNGECKGMIDGLPVYLDSNHLSERGSQLLIPTLQQIASHMKQAGTLN